MTRRQRAEMFRDSYLDAAAYTSDPTIISDGWSAKIAGLLKMASIWNAIAMDSD